MVRARAGHYGVPGLQTATLARQSGFSVIDWRCPGSICDSESDESTGSYELIFTRAGSWVVQCREGSLFVDSGHVLLRPPDIPFQVIHPTGHQDAGTLIVLGGGLASSVMALATTRSGLEEGMLDRILVAPVPPQLCVRHHILARRLSRQLLADPLEVEAGVLELLAESFTALSCHSAPDWSSASETRRRHLRQVQDAKRLLAERYRESVTVAEVANVVGASPFHFSRLFRFYTGTSIHRYLNRLRLTSSIEMILDSKHTLSHIALELGFSSHSHFTEAFRKEFHFPPSQARKAVLLPRPRNRPS